MLIFNQRAAVVSSKCTPSTIGHYTKACPRYFCRLFRPASGLLIFQIIRLSQKNLNNIFDKLLSYKNLIIKPVDWSKLANLQVILINNSSGVDDAFTASSYVIRSICTNGVV
jgi:hypothetical protein